MSIQLGSKGLKISGVEYPAFTVIVGLSSVQEVTAVQGGDAAYLAPAASQPAAVQAVLTAMAAAGIKRFSFSSDGLALVTIGAAPAPAPAPADTTAPTASSAAVANAAPTVIVVTFSEAMDTSSVPAASAFTVGGHAVSAVAFADSTHLNVAVSSAFVNGEAARTLAYTQPGTGNLKDSAGNLLANIASLAITNNVAAVVVPTNPRFGYAPANPTGDPTAFATLFAGMTNLTGSASGGRAGTFNTVASTTNYTWLAVLHSAAPGGIHVFDGTGFGGFSGASATGIFGGVDADPITASLSYTDGNGNVWDMYRSNGKASTFATFTLS